MTFAHVFFVPSLWKLLIPVIPLMSSFISTQRFPFGFPQDAGVGVFCDLFSFYLHVGSHATHYDVEIEALHQLSVRLSTPDKPVNLSDSSSALQALASNQDKVPESIVAGSC
ncbi:hypothetical protein TNCT_723381 [Trichonephila clavata]|uniref:Uncharacterized protein n=1 Tax=Trichonephila clavata TaxID=2740835 RepID=A0A8X6I1Y3_TRICU|nr:hypothetical protein TNCT_723381 [Trichonephila clavata]